MDYQKHFIPTQLISRGIQMQISVTEVAVFHADVDPEEFCLHRLLFFCNIITFSICLQANRGNYITNSLCRAEKRTWLQSAENNSWCCWASSVPTGCGTVKAILLPAWLVFQVDSAQDCLPWEGPHAGTREECESPPPEEEGAAENV